MGQWCTGQVKPGQFTGQSTLRPLTKVDHRQGVQAWARKVSVFVVRIHMQLFLGSSPSHLSISHVSHWMYVLTFQNMFAGLAPVMSSFGLKMLKKMGWKEGTPLGRAGVGRVEPIELSIKVDRQGRCVHRCTFCRFTIHFPRFSFQA